jgi:hypothetical protein
LVGIVTGGPTAPLSVVADALLFAATSDAAGLRLGGPVVTDVGVYAVRPWTEASAVVARALALTAAVAPAVLSAWRSRCALRDVCVSERTARIRLGVARVDPAGAGVSRVAAADGQSVRTRCPAHGGLVRVRDRARATGVASAAGVVLGEPVLQVRVGRRAAQRERAESDGRAYAKSVRSHHAISIVLRNSTLGFCWAA